MGSDEVSTCCFIHNPLPNQMRIISYIKQTSFVCVHFRWFGVLAVKQWAISVLDVFGVTTTQCRLECILAAFHSGPIFTIWRQHLFNTAPQPLIWTSEHSRLRSYVSLSKKTILLSFASWFKIWLTPWSPGFLFKFHLSLFWRWFSSNSRWYIIIVWNWHEHLQWYNKSLNELWCAGR